MAERSLHEPVMTADEVERFLRREFPQMYLDGDVFRIGSIEPERIRMILDPQERHLRPGGTVSGPTLFTLADVSAYVAVLSHVGEVALALTTSLNINFLRRPALGLITGEARILKLGRRLAIMDVSISDAASELVAHATATYSIPLR